jgi:hypothetical protein
MTIKSENLDPSGWEESYRKEPLGDPVPPRSVMAVVKVMV